MKENSKKTLIIFGFIVILLTISGKIYGKYVGFFGINTETCIKGRYFYIDRTVRHKLKNNDYFAFRYKGDKLYPKGYIFIKILGCMPGQKLISRNTEKGYGYYCDGRLLGYACDPHVYPTCPNHTKYNLIIPKNHFYALGTAYNAYDSRYWGLVDIKSVIGKAHKLF